jgi:hypothetical protein
MPTLLSELKIVTAKGLQAWECAEFSLEYLSVPSRSTEEPKKAGRKVTAERRGG